MVTPYKHEKSLFTIAAILSSVFWLALTVGTLGIALLYLALGFVFYLFVHSGFISYLRYSGVRLSERQYPELHRRFTECCSKLGMETQPEAYVLRTDLFNALATKFLGRHFVVLFSDVVDALEARPGALDFYIGHELGHIKGRHLVWGWFLAPAMVLPLLGASLRRAQEYSCDRYGVACCSNAEDVQAALGAMVAGNSLWSTFDAAEFATQSAAGQGFWASFHELTNDYPWLSKRVAAAIAVRKGQEPEFPSRNLLAWPFALLVPRFGGAGGAGSLLVAIALVGIIAAVALPAYQDYTVRAKLAQPLAAGAELEAAVNEYYARNQAWPASLSDLGYTESPIPGPDGQYEVDIYDDGVVGIDVSAITGGEKQYLVLSPVVGQGGELEWTCSGQDVPAKYLPAACK